MTKVAIVEMGSQSDEVFLTVDDSQSLPQRGWNAVDVFEDGVGGPGQVVHLRLQFTDGLLEMFVINSMHLYF